MKNPLNWIDWDVIKDLLKAIPTLILFYVVLATALIAPAFLVAFIIKNFL